MKLRMVMPSAPKPDLGSIRVHDLDLDHVIRLDRVVAVAGHLERQHLPEQRRKRGWLLDGQPSEIRDQAFCRRIARTHVTTGQLGRP